MFGSTSTKFGVYSVLYRSEARIRMRKRLIWYGKTNEILVSFKTDPNQDSDNDTLKQNTIMGKELARCRVGCTVDPMSKRGPSLPQLRAASNHQQTP